MKKILLFVLVFSFCRLYGQHTDKSLYLSGNVGIYKSTGNTTYRNLGSSRIGGGIGLGFRLLDNVFFYSRAQYISKSDFSGYYDNSYIDPDLAVVHVVRPAGVASASVSQLIVNSGLQYNIYNSKEFIIGLLAGLTYTMIDQEARSSSGIIINKINNQGYYGYFGGANIEKYFRNSDVTLFAEVLYNYIDENSLYFRDAFSGMNFTIGGRYYLAD